MSTTSTIQLRAKGSLTLPAELRRKYELSEGDVFTLIDLGGGAFLLSTRLTQVDRLGDRVAELVADQGVSQEELQTVLEEEREKYYHERYAPR